MSGKVTKRSSRLKLRTCMWIWHITHKEGVCFVELLQCFYFMWPWKKIYAMAEGHTVTTSFSFARSIPLLYLDCL